MKVIPYLAAIRGANRIRQGFAARKRSLQSPSMRAHSGSPWIIVVTAVALATPAFAANWQDGGGGSPADTLWSNVANWSTGVVPGEGATIGENVAFPTFAASKTVDIGATNYAVGTFLISPADNDYISYNGTGTITASALNIGANGPNTQPDYQTFNANLVISGNILVQRKSGGHIFNGSVSAGGLNFGQSTNTFNGPVTITGANGLEVFYSNIGFGGGPVYVFNNTITSANGGSVFSSDAGSPATLKAGNAGTLSGITGPLDIQANGILNLAVAQTGYPTGGISVAAYGLLLGDTGTATWGPGNHIDVAENGILATSAGSTPTTGDIGVAVAWQGVTGTGTWTAGNDGTSVFKGLAVGSFKSDLNSITLQAPVGAGDVEILVLPGLNSNVSKSANIVSLDGTGIANFHCLGGFPPKGGTLNPSALANSVTTFNFIGEYTHAQRWRVEVLRQFDAARPARTLRHQQALLLQQLQGRFHRPAADAQPLDQLVPPRHRPLPAPAPQMPHQGCAATCPGMAKRRQTRRRNQPDKNQTGSQCGFFSFFLCSAPVDPILPALGPIHGCRTAWQGGRRVPRTSPRTSMPTTMKPGIHTRQSLAAVAGLALTAASANAAVIATLTSEAVNGSPHVGTIQATVGDLLETVGSVAGESFQVPLQHVTASVFDGKITTGIYNGANGGDPDAGNAAGYYGTGNFIEFNLDTTTNTLGYDISTINIIQRGDSFRGGINVAVSVRQVGGSYTPLISPPDAGTPGNVNMYAITNDSGPLVASGIDGVRFDFTNTATGSISGWTWYRELDVIGTATVPEPSAAALLGLGALALLRHRRK